MYLNAHEIEAILYSLQ